MSELIKYVLKVTFPILLGYLFLGMSFGIMLGSIGYEWYWALFISLVVYAGSGQFLLVSFLAGSGGFLDLAIMTLLLNSRHIFYGLSFLDVFKKMKAYPYMIFSLTDETYALQSAINIKNFDENKTRFLISLFNQCYWIIGSIVGCVFANQVSFNPKGIEFSMTALFIVIFIEQAKECHSYVPAYIGFGSALLSLLVFKSNNFILPAIVISVILLTIYRKEGIQDAR